MRRQSEPIRDRPNRARLPRRHTPSRTAREPKRPNRHPTKTRLTLSLRCVSASKRGYAGKPEFSNFCLIDRVVLARIALRSANRAPPDGFHVFCRKRRRSNAEEPVAQPGGRGIRENRQNIRQGRFDRNISAIRISLTGAKNRNYT